MQVDVPFYDQAHFNQTTIHPLGLAAVVVMGALTLVLPRRFAILPIFIVVCFIPTAQRWVVFGLDFTLLRTMVMFGGLRLLIRGELRGLRLHRVDYSLLMFAAVGSIAYTMLRGDVSSFVNRAGASFDALGIYFLFRNLIRTWTDLDRFISGVVMISIPVAVFFLVEKSTGRNVFSVFGGVPKFTHVREGALRCRGAYSHPILAGCFWAALVPLMTYKWRTGRKGRVQAIVGVTCATTIIICCASSTPIIGLMTAAVGLALFKHRRRMRMFRWSTVAALFFLHLVMNHPVWHLLARINITGGSTGFHRFYLVDQAIARFDEWWLMGVLSTAHWGHGLFDITNQYVLEGTRGGFAALVLFCLALGFAFAAAGRQSRINRQNKNVQYLAWAIGVTLAVHAVNMVAVSYFGGIVLGFYGSLGVAGALYKKAPLPAARVAASLKRRAVPALTTPPPSTPVPTRA